MSNSNQAVRELALALNSGTTEERQQHAQRALGLLGLPDGVASPNEICGLCGDPRRYHTPRTVLRFEPTGRYETPAPTDYEPSEAQVEAAFDAWLNYEGCDGRKWMRAALKAAWAVKT